MFYDVEEDTVQVLAIVPKAQADAWLKAAVPQALKLTSLASRVARLAAGRPRSSLRR